MYNKYNPASVQVHWYSVNIVFVLITLGGMLQCNLSDFMRNLNSSQGVQGVQSGSSGSSDNSLHSIWSRLGPVYHQTNKHQQREKQGLLASQFLAL